MIVFPNCKINLGLHLTSKRPDGYHDIETIFYPLPINDVLEIIPTTSQLEFTISGNSIEGEKKNLCIRAYSLLKDKFPSMGNVLIHLHKHIPVGAGLGGGSADGSFTLQLLNRIFNLNLDQEELLELSLQLGSDCPFFIINEPCIGRGRGEMLEKITVDLSDYNIIVVYPGIHIDTGNVFKRSAIQSQNAESIPSVIARPVKEWKDHLINDLEPIVFEQYPEIKKIKTQLYDSGAVYASLSGSGSSVYGIIEKGNSINIDFPSTYFIKNLPGK